MNTKQRPPVWIGHVSLPTRALDATETFMKQIGLRPIFRNDEVAVLELRGGTHLVLTLDEKASSNDAEFDFMVEDIDETYADFVKQGYEVTKIERGRIHDSFRLTEPGGNRVVVNSTHVPDHDAV